MEEGMKLMKTEFIQLVRGFLVKKVNPSFIIVFGSYAKGTNHPNSDIDLAFFSESTSLSSYELFIVAQELVELLKKEYRTEIQSCKTSSIFK